MSNPTETVIHKKRAQVWAVCMVPDRRELIIANELQDGGREVFVPTLRTWGRPPRKRRCEWRREVVYPNYIFVRDDRLGILGPMLFDLKRQVWPVRFGDLVATVNGRQIDEMRDRLMGGGYDHDEDDLAPPFKTGDEVDVVAGVCEGLRGQVKTISTNGRTMILEGLDFYKAFEVSVLHVAGPTGL